MIKVTLKDPDGFFECVRDAVEESVSDLPLSPSEKEAVCEERFDTTREAMRRWVEYGEYVTLAFDLDAGTATVEECRR